MANVVITGGAGFLGSRLARDLLAAGSLDVAGEGERPLSRVTLIDRVPPPPDLAGDPRVAVAEGDLAGLVDPGQPGREALAGADVVFHLAAAVSGECEADFDLGMRANLHATEALLAAIRAAGTSPLVVYSSSIAVFGGSPELPLPAVVEDQTLPNPQTSYGIQKFIGEQLLADYSRKGFLRGRGLRLMTVSVRPAGPTPRLPGSCRASSASRSRASARSARSIRAARWRWPPRPGPSRRCGAPPPHRTTSGTAGPR